MLHPAVPRHRSAYALTAVGTSLIATCYGLARFAYGLYLPDFREAFTLDAATAGAVATGSYVAYCLGIGISTWLAARLGARTAAVTAGAAAVVGTATVALAPGTGLLFVGIMVAGSSTGMASPPLAQAVAHTVPSRLQDRVQSVINAGTGLGVAVSGPVAMLDHGRWRLAWLAFAVTAAAVTLAVAVVIPPSRANRRTPARPGPRLLAPGNGRMILTALLAGAASSAVWTFGRDTLLDAGLSATESTTVWIVIGVAGLIGGLTGDLPRLIGAAWSWRSSLAALGAATVLLPLATTSALAILCGVVFGASYIAVTALLLLAGTQLRPEQPATGVAVAFLALAVGQAVGAPVVGGLLDATGPVTTFGAASVIAALSALVTPAPSHARPLL